MNTDSWTHIPQEFANYHQADAKYFNKGLYKFHTHGVLGYASPGRPERYVGRTGSIARLFDEEVSIRMVTQKPRIGHGAPTIGFEFRLPRGERPGWTVKDTDNHYARMNFQSGQRSIQYRKITQAERLALQFDSANFAVEDRAAPKDGKIPPVNWNANDNILAIKFIKSRGESPVFSGFNWPFTPKGSESRHLANLLSAIKEATAWTFFVPDDPHWHRILANTGYTFGMMGRGDSMNHYRDGGPRGRIT